MSQNMTDQVEEIEIKKLEDLVYRHIEKNKRIVNTKIINITAPGENYGSSIFKIDISLEDDLKTIETVSIFAKMSPPTALLRQLFNFQVAFKLEAAFYEVIIPTLHNFQREKGIRDVIDFFPNFYGARMNLGDDDTVDENAIILLENLKQSGYVNLNRLNGFDLDAAKLVLKDMAQFHAVPIALKLQKPEEFDEKVKVYMACFHPEPPEFDYGPVQLKISKILRQREFCVPLLPKIENSVRHMFDLPKTFREPFATIVHRDMWVNNFMVKLEDGKVIRNKLLDFQAYTYSSPVKDLLFFLFTSVQFDVLRKNLENLLRFYHEQFTQTLSDLDCCTIDFSYDKFIEEIKHYGTQEIGHILSMLLFIVHGEKSENGDPWFTPIENISLEVKQQAWWILQEFENRMWMDI